MELKMLRIGKSAEELERPSSKWEILQVHPVYLTTLYYTKHTYRT